MKKSLAASLQLGLLLVVVIFRMPTSHATPVPQLEGTEDRLQHLYNELWVITRDLAQAKPSLVKPETTDLSNLPARIKASKTDLELLTLQSDQGFDACVLPREGELRLEVCEKLKLAAQALAQCLELFAQQPDANRLESGEFVSANQLLLTALSHVSDSSQLYQHENHHKELRTLESTQLLLKWLTTFGLLCALGAAYFAYFARRKAKMLSEKDSHMRDYIRKLELLGKDVRRLRDLGAAFDTTAGILSLDQKFRLLTANDSFRKMRELSQPSVREGQSIQEIFGLQDDSCLEGIMEDVSASQIWRGEFEGQKADGSALWFYALFYPELDELEDFEGAIVLVLDITESKKAQLTFERSRHLTVLGEMAGGISHEINNPLSVINGRVSVLLKKAKKQQYEEGVFVTGLEQILKTTQRIAKIVDSMRRLSRADAGNQGPELGKACEVLKEVREFTEDKINKYNINLIFEDAQNLGETPLYLRGLGLSQILINVISNAIDAIDLNQYPERWIKVQLRLVAENSLQFIIADPGPGISPELQRKIMDPFFTTKSASRGTGLGLSLSLRLAEDHGGRLFIDNAAPTTSFVLEVPIAKPQPELTVQSAS